MITTGKNLITVPCLISSVNIGWLYAFIHETFHQKSQFNMNTARTTSIKAYKNAKAPFPLLV